MLNLMDPKTLAAGVAYTAYTKAVGGKAFNGEPLPSWEEFATHPDKQKQAEAWVQAAIASTAYHKEKLVLVVAVEALKSARDIIQKEFDIAVQDIEDRIAVAGLTMEKLQEVFGV